MLCPAILYWHYLDAQDKLINGLIICAAQIVVEFDGVDAGSGGDSGGDKSVKKLSKTRQKVEKASKIWKICKGHWFGGTFTEAPILRWRTQASVRVLTVFRALFAGSRSSFDITFALIIDKAKLIKLLICCPHQVFTCIAHVFPPLLRLWDVLRHQDDSRTRYARFPSS